MRLLYFHQHFSTPSGATGIRSYQMARIMVERGHHVTMVCGSHRLGATGLEGPFVRGRRRGCIDGIDIVEFDLSYSNHDGFLKRSLIFLKFALGSIGLALRERYDMAFATTTPLTVAIPVLVAKLLRGRNYIFEVRDLWPELPREMGVITNPVVLWLLSALEFLAYRGATHCIALSPGIARGIARRGVDEDRITMIPNGCDIELLADAPEPERPDGVADSDLLAIFAGTHGQANGLGAVLDAAAVLKARGRSDIRFFLVGDGKEKGDLVQRASRDGLDNVIFHEPVPKARLARLLAGADAGLQVLADVPAFYFGTSPNKFFDYLATGKPVVTNYPGWVAGLVTENHAGIAVPPRDPEAFADAMVRLADHRDALPQMGKAASRLAKSRFDRRLLAQEWAETVERTVKKRIPGRQED